MENENLSSSKKVLEKLQETKVSINLALEAANIYYFEYFPEEGYAIKYNGREEFDLEEKLENYPDSWFAKNITHPDDEYILRNAFEIIKDGGKKAKCNVRNLISGKYRWYRYNFTSLYNGDNKRIKVVCTAQNIAEEQKAHDLNKELNRLYDRTPGWIFTGMK